MRPKLLMAAICLNFIHCAEPSPTVKSTAVTHQGAGIGSGNSNPLPTGESKAKLTFAGTTYDSTRVYTDLYWSQNDSAWNYYIQIDVNNGDKPLSGLTFHILHKDGAMGNTDQTKNIMSYIPQKNGLCDSSNLKVTFTDAKEVSGTAHLEGTCGVGLLDSNKSDDNSFVTDVTFFNPERKKVKN